MLAAAMGRTSRGMRSQPAASTRTRPWARTSIRRSMTSRARGWPEATDGVAGREGVAAGIAAILAPAGRGEGMWGAAATFCRGTRGGQGRGLSRANSSATVSRRRTRCTWSPSTMTSAARGRVL